MCERTLSTVLQLLVVGLTACPSPPVDRVEPQLIEQTRRRLEASNRGDKNEYGRDIEPSGIFTDGNGSTHTATDMIADVTPPRPPRVLQFAAIRDVRFVDVGDTAVLSYVLPQHDSAARGGSVVNYRKTDVFARRRGGVWRLLAMQATVIPGPAPVSAPTPDPGRYAGTYELVPGVTTVVRERAGELTYELPGEIAEALVPRADGGFSTRSGLRRVIFQANDAGAIVGFVFRRYPGGGDLTGSRRTDATDHR